MKIKEFNMTLKTIKELEAEFEDYNKYDYPTTRIIINAEILTLKDVIKLIDEYFEKKKSFIQNNFITKKFNSFQMEEALEEIEEELKARING